MGITVRKTAEALTRAVVLQHNALVSAVTEQLTTFPHGDITSTTSGHYSAPGAAAMITTLADATTLPTTIALANDLKLKINLHIADGSPVHKAADATNGITTAVASDQTTSNTLLNAIKAKYNAHLILSGVHFTNDATNTVTAADATDAGSSQTLATEIKAKYNAHIIFALGNVGLKLIAA
jgi:hypothetical protein